MWRPVGDDRLDAEVVLSEPRTVVLPPDHALAARESVALAELDPARAVFSHCTSIKR